MMYLMSQLGSQAPAFLVYLIAFVLALVYMRRATMPSILTLVGVGILVVTTIGVAVVQAWLINNRDGASLSSLMGILVVASSCIRAIGLGLLVSAIFVGRRPMIGS